MIVVVVVDWWWLCDKSQIVPVGIDLIDLNWPD